MMRARVFFAARGAALAAVALSSAPWVAAVEAQTPDQGTPELLQATISQYCVTCHNEDRLETGGLNAVAV